MVWRRVSQLAVLMVATTVLTGTTAQALGNMPVISHVKTGESGFATREYAAIYNNSGSVVDVTDWCVVYSSASDATKVTLACLMPPDANTRLLLQPFSYARFASTEFKDTITDFTPDGLFSAGMSGTSGHLRLLDAGKNEIDKVGWGAAGSPEGLAIPAHTANLVLKRKNVDAAQQLQDSDNNQADFENANLDVIPASGIVEEMIPQDVCSNIEGLQITTPDGYGLDNEGLCIQDQCLNLDGLQTQVPSGYEKAAGETCTAVQVVLESSVVQITEVLPNVSGVDDGNEFVELYNPNNRAIDLAGYRLELGPAYTKQHIFVSELLNPFAFRSFGDILTGLTLPNTSANLRLVSPAGNVVSETAVYESPKDDQAWALIDDVWQFTDQLTPGLANLPKAVPVVVVTSDDDELADCGPGRYRNPETNRCRNIQTGDVELQPCQSDQVRNPDTNRCRSIAASSTLTPCREGQVRNPETNRCRSVVLASAALQPCDPGEERNPETNRCRKVATLGTSAMADVEDVPAATTNNTNWWILGSVLLLAGGYGLYEWRYEIGRIFRGVFGKTN